LNLLLGETSNPQAPFDDTLHRLELVFCTGINETEETLDNSRCGAIALKVDKKTAVIAANLSRFLGIVGKIVDIETW
jgi:hypothetical protein